MSTNLDDCLNNLGNELDDQLRQYGLTDNNNLFQQSLEAADYQFCPECGTKVPAKAKFCPTCGQRLEEESPGTEAVPLVATGSEAALVGVILTDLKKLAEKYSCTEETVKEVINKFREQSKAFSMEWYLMNAPECVEDTEEPFWLDYNEAISVFMRNHKLPVGIKTPLFIIGGDDVIPIPKVEDVFGTSDDGMIPCDMCYGFEGNFFSDLWDGGDHTITDDYVRNNVSRLPLEDGVMNSYIEDDFEAYFNICSIYYEHGIPVENVVMTANASWLPASKTMSEHLPLIQHTNDPEMVKDGMYVSPPVSPDNDEAVDSVCDSMADSGMLLFNLHGSDTEGMSSFYSDSGEAFVIEMLASSEARVFNTVACFGARYHGYERDDSMMLSAFYNNGFLLYAGSLIPVPMTDLDVPDGVEVHEGSGSEHLMPIYCMEQFRGLPAGEAMMRAKLEYFNTFRHMERDDFSLATAMMFSLYGNPMLRLQPNEEVLRRSQECHVLPELPHMKYANPIHMKRLQRIMTKDDVKSGSLLEEIRGRVDANLTAIHSQIQRHLYDAYGLEPRWLDHVDAFEMTNSKGRSQQGYCYTYVDKSKPFAQKSMVEVDRKGNVTKLFRTK